MTTFIFTHFTYHIPYSTFLPFGFLHVQTITRPHTPTHTHSTINRPNLHTHITTSQAYYPWFCTTQVQTTCPPTWPTRAIQQKIQQNSNYIWRGPNWRVEGHFVVVGIVRPNSPDKAAGEVWPHPTLFQSLLPSIYSIWDMSFLISHIAQGL